MGGHKLLIFLVVVLAALALFLAGYSISRRTLTADLSQPLTANSLVNRFDKTTEKKSQPIGTFVISKGAADFPVLVSGGKEVLYYNPDSGEIRSVQVSDLAGGSTVVAKIQSHASRIIWSANKTLVAFYDTGATYYDLNNNYSKRLGGNIKNPALAKAGNKIAYNYFDGRAGSGSVSVADPQSTVFKNILATRFPDWQIGWLDSSRLWLIRPASEEFSTSLLFSLDIDSGRFEKILEASGHLEVLWSAGGQKFVYSYADPSTQATGLYMLDPETRDEALLAQDIHANQCAWSIDSKTIYCVSGQSLVTIDTSGPYPKAQPVLIHGDSTPLEHATNLTLTSTEDYLLFLDSAAHQLYALRLSQ